MCLPAWARALTATQAAGVVTGDEVEVDVDLDSAKKAEKRERRIGKALAGPTDAEHCRKSGGLRMPDSAARSRPGSHTPERVTPRRRVGGAF
jgi:hypothetical protein